MVYRRRHQGCFDNIDQHTLIRIIRKRVKDEHFIALIWKFLRAGYMENWKWNGTYSGAAQGSVISPILSNIYMNELDKYIMEYKEKFDIGVQRAGNAEYARRKSRWYCYKQTTEKTGNTIQAKKKKSEQTKSKTIQSMVLIASNGTYGQTIQANSVLQIC